VRSVVSHCSIYDTGPTNARGGAIFASRGLSLKQSVLSDNHAYSVDGVPIGGAAYVGGTLKAKYSTISDNWTYIPYGTAALSEAGGVFVTGNVEIEYSTISRNRGGMNTGLDIRGTASNSALISNSTISSNTAGDRDAGIYSQVPLALYNDTIVFNTSLDSTAGNGVHVRGSSALTTYSSIISGNGGAGGESDVYAENGIAGGYNLIVSSWNGMLPAHTVQACPRLEPLLDNGGFTLTHALRHDSPAIDQGINPSNFPQDQRFEARMIGAGVDIGSVERQGSETDERLLASGFDGLCDH